MNIGVSKKSTASKRWLSALVAGILLWQLPSAGAAEQAEEFSLEGVVVTATKTPVKQFEVNANISVISREDIENRHYRNLAEALRDVPGVSMAVYGGGVGYERSSGLRINGSDKVVVLIDGVRVNIAGERYQATAVQSLDQIERIEVLKGAASALYGSDAKGGVINIITRKVDGQKTVLALEGGSFDHEAYRFSHQGGDNGYVWRITSAKHLEGSYKDGQGATIPQHSNADINTLYIGRQLSDRASLDFYYDQYKADGMYHSFAAGSNQRSQRNYFSNDNYNWRMIYQQQLSKNADNQLSYYHSSFDETYEGSRTQIKTVGVQEQFTRKLSDKHVLTAGFDFSKDDIRAGYYDTKVFNRALYVQNEWSVDKRWNITAGVRSDWHSGYDTSITPRIAVGYKQNDATNYYISYNEFFIAPTPYQLYSELYGNDNLQPEEGQQLEFGINHRLDDTTTAAFHIFQRKSDNVTGWLASGGYKNFDESSHGWDVQLSKQLSPTVHAFVGYTATIVDETPERRRNVDGYVPKGAWNVGVDYQEGKYLVNLTGQGIYDRLGPNDDNSYAQYFPQTTYWVWNVAVNYKAGKHVAVFAKVNNLFDTYYAEHSGATARPGWGGAEGKWWTSPGRNVQFGVTYSF